MELKDIVQQESNNDNRTVNLVLRKEQYNASQEDAIDLVHMLKLMWDKKMVYIWLMLALTILGAAFACFKVQTNLSKYGTGYARALMSLDYVGGAEALAPDGTELNLAVISSPYIITRAINNTNLSKVISSEAVASSLTVERILSDATKQQLEVIDIMMDKDKTNVQNALDVEYVYTNKIYLTLKNSFDEGEALTDAELRALLDSIIQSYNQYMYETYAEFVMPSNTFANMNISELDYTQTIDLINTGLSELKEFCETGVGEDMATYRLSTNGMRLLDIANLIAYVQENDLSYLTAYVHEQGLSNNPGRSLVTYEYNLRNYGYDYDALMENIKSNSEMIQNYKNDENTLMNQNGSAMSVGATVTDHYNSLILNQMEYYSQKRMLLTTIKNTEDRVESLNSAINHNTNDAKVAQEISDLYNKCLVIYDMIDELTEEILDSVSYKNSYLFVLSSQYERKSFFSADTFKTIGKFAAIGLVLAIMVWGVDAVIAEFNYTDKKKGGLSDAR